jgi:hypothetical protein
MGLLLAACGGVTSTGSFDGVTFTPGPLAFAVVDRHDITPSGGSYLAVQREESAMTLSIVLSGAMATATDSWRDYPAERLLSLKKELATLDGLHLHAIPLTRVVAGESLERRGVPGTEDAVEELQADVVVALPDAANVERQGLGADIAVKLTFDRVDLSQGGVISGVIELKRARAEGQSGEVATGELSVHFSAPVVTERLGKANLSVVAPVMACAAALGPVRAGSCRDEEALPIVLSSGPLSDS